MQHPTLEQLKLLQIKRASLVKEKDYVKNPETLLAVSVLQIQQKIRAGGILFDLKSRSQLDSQVGKLTTTSSPYISSFLSLRNKQPLLQIIRKFSNFDVLMVEGAGKQHPRHYGLACELGVDLDIPTIGITKSSLYGITDFSQPHDLGEPNFDFFPVFDEDYLIAYFIKKITNKQGIFLSVGHKISLQTAVDIVLPFIVYKLPEPLRLVKILLKRST
ncbi:MAG: endonuclease V [Candidatus Heimdallarchaeota archaeon]|nr:MAG: endonuclease V [Candidatus Heimdallarchaeota archaeon]